MLVFSSETKANSILSNLLPKIYKQHNLLKFRKKLLYVENIYKFAYVHTIRHI
jgi:hypothetical protein